MNDNQRKKYLKSTNYLKKSLGSHLERFENLREWPDFGNWLQKTAKFLEDYPTPDIPYKLELAKRLAQCLNPILPHGTHKITLSVYSIVFRNLRLAETWIKNMPLFCIGLFPFFQNCSIQVKPEFIALIYENFLQMGIELIPMLTGLVTSILPGLEEQDEMLQKKVLKLLSGIKQSVGQRFLIGAVWIAILKTPKVRMPAIKFLNKQIKKINQLQSGEVSDVNYKKRIANSMKIIEMAKNRQWLDSHDHRVEKELFDTLISSIEESINDENFYFPKGILIVNACLACLQSDQVIVKRAILDFICAYLPLSSEEHLSHREKLVLVEGTIKLFRKKDMSINRRIYKWLFGGDVDNEIQITDENQYNFQLMIDALKRIFNEKKRTEKEAVLPIKIMGNIFVEHEELTEAILKKLAPDFILYYYCTVEDSEDAVFRKEVFNQGMKLIDNLGDYMSLLLNCFRDEVITGGRTQLEVIKILKYLINSFLKNESSDNRRKANHLRIALISVLGQINQVDLGDLKSLTGERLELVVLCAKSVKEQTEALRKITEDSVITTRETVADEAFVANLVTFTENITDMLRSLNEEMPMDLKSMKGLFKDCVSLLIKSFEYTQTLQPIQQDTLPEWLKQMCLILRLNPQYVGHICLRYLLKIIELGRVSNRSEKTRVTMMTRDSGEGSQMEEVFVWETIREILLSEGLKDVLDFKLQQELAEQVWTYFCQSENSEESVSMIINLCESSSNFFVTHLKELIHNVDIEMADESYRQISTFWKLTQTGIFKRAEEVQNIRSEIVFDMLSFIDAPNPLLRYSAKGWLNACSKELETIINPLFIKMLEKTDWETRPEFYYNNQYPTDIISKAFKSLKDMLIVMGNNFLDYFSNTVTGAELKPYIPKLNESKLINIKFPLIDMLSLISLRYIQGRCDGNLNERFELENLKVKAIACEFLEMVLSRLTDVKMMQQISCYLMQPVVTVLKSALENEETGILIQLISLLNVILFKSKLHENKKNDPTGARSKYIAFLENPLFIETLLKGLRSRVLYVLTEFRNFTSSTILVLSEILTHPNLTQLVRRILNVYYELISRRGRPTQSADDSFSNDLSETQVASLNFGPDVSSNNAKNSARLNVLIEGLEFALKTFVGGGNVRDIQVEQEESVFLSIITLGMASRSKSSSENDKFFKKHENVGKAILNDMSTQLDAFRACWYPGKKFREVVNLTNLGCLPFSMETSKPYIIDSFHSKLKEINLKMLKIIKPFGKRFMKNLVNEILSYWILSFNDSVEVDEGVSNRLSTIIEIVSESGLHPIEFLQSLAKTNLIKSIEKKNSGLRKKLMRGSKYSIEIVTAKRESRILYFIYNYLRYMKLDYGLKADARASLYMTYWVAVSCLLDCFSESNSLNTAFWILEIFSLMSIKFNFSDLMNHVYSDFFKVLNSTISFVSSFAAGKLNLDLKNLMSSQNEITPLCPSIYQIHQKFINKKRELKDNMHIIDEKILSTEFNFVQQVQAKYQFQSFKILSEFVKTPLFYQGENTKLDRLILRIREMSNNVFSVMSNRRPDNLHLIESASEVIYNLMTEQTNKHIVRELKKDILEIFNMDYFFKCTPDTLKYWSKIIDLLATLGKEDLLQIYLKDVNFSSVFKSKATEYKTRIRSFERVCFIIYSGDVDKYMTKKKIKSLLEKIRNVIKDESTHPSLQVLIMFCLRVLILRLSSMNLNELFRSIWPILLTLLIRTFNNAKLPDGIEKKTNVHVVLAALKLLEFLSVCNIEEFNVYQWIFIYDYFGVSINPIPQNKNTDEKTKQLGDVDTIRLVSPLAFKPFLTSCIPERLKIDYLGNAFTAGDFETRTSKEEKRRILITQNNIETEFELQAKAQELLTYLIYLNQTRVYVDPHDVEILIQNDFIGLSNMMN